MPGGWSLTLQLQAPSVIPAMGFETVPFRTDTNGWDDFQGSAALKEPYSYRRKGHLERSSCKEQGHSEELQINLSYLEEWPLVQAPLKCGNPNTSCLAPRSLQTIIQIFSQPPLPPDPDLSSLDIHLKTWNEAKACWVHTKQHSQLNLCNPFWPGFGQWSHCWYYSPLFVIVLVNVSSKTEY